MLIPAHGDGTVSPTLQCWPSWGKKGLTTPALIRGDTQASNLLSAQFRRTMEFRPHQYAALWRAPRLAQRH